MVQLRKDAHDVLTIQASQAVVADGSGSAIRLARGIVNAFVFTLDVTAAATDAEDKLDVYVQTKADGTNWVDVVHFTQCDGNGGAKRYISKITASGAQTMFETGAALAESAVRNLLGDEYRVRWDVTEAGPAGPTSGSGTGLVSFTFSVTAIPM